jgi:hypothetical protein
MEVNVSKIRRLQWKETTSSTLGRILKHFVQASDEAQSAKLELVLRFSHYDWFMRAFLASNGKGLLGDIVLNVHPNGFAEISRLLGDQIVFSKSKKDLDFWLSCSYTCLQSLGVRYGALQRTEESDTFTSFLQKILVWTLKKSIQVRRSSGDTDDQLENWSLELEEIATERRNNATDKEDHKIPLVEQNFYFVVQLSSSEWEEWLVGLRTILMGTRLGGLGIEPLPKRARMSVRDPGGICGCMISDHLA